MTIKNNEKITCVGALKTARGLSLETIKKGGSMGGFFLNHGFFEGKQGPKGPRNSRKSGISDVTTSQRYGHRKQKPAKLTKWAKQLIIICRHQGPEYKIQGRGRKPKPVIPKTGIADWEVLTCDLTEVLITKSVRRLVQGWLPIRQKNTVVRGDFS